MRESGKDLIVTGRVSDALHQMWLTSTVEIIRKTYGSNSPLARTIVGQTQVRMAEYGADNESRFEYENAREMKKTVEALNGLINQIQMEIDLGESSMDAPKPLDFWSQLHPEVVKHAKSRYETGHYADAVEAALKALNEIVKNFSENNNWQRIGRRLAYANGFFPKQFHHYA
ncbi:MAG TPA: TIGR02391 family protein [Verrucomicrobiae bacterium]|nr:TIGR02391 family protein [Verrucomicrobiae bacterium]